MEFAGLNETGGKPHDGVGLVPILSGREEALLERPLHFYHGQNGPHNEHYGIIDRGWKLVIIGNDIREGETPAHETNLFKIDDDPEEKYDKKSDHPEIYTRLLKSLTDMLRVQPANGLPPYYEGRGGFVAPKEWHITK